MGRGIASRHQRFVKAEKSKVKLKGKKDLPKGTNVTKTAFKVKKIVIREQTKNVLDTDQPLSKTKLNIKELVSRLAHFNSSARVDALNGLKDLITAFGNVTLANNLGLLVKRVAPLVLDKERSVRRESYKLLHMILTPLTLDKIVPFFDVLCLFLRCAMTHIETRIYEDSLLYFDILLECAPDLLAINIHKIFPSFLDMISKLRMDSKPGRTLVVNLGSKMTSIKWRIKVLSRLHQFLETLLNLKRNVKNNIEDDNLFSHSNGCTRVYDTKHFQYFPLYQGLSLAKLTCFSKDKNSFINQINEGEKLKCYIEVLIPLLFETWLEVRPASHSDSKTVESVVSEEGALILRSILQILYLLWCLSKLAEEEQRNTEITPWFANKYRKDFSQYMLNSFPYIQSKQRMKKSQGPSINLIEKVADEKCLEENLTLCHIFVIMNSGNKSLNHSQTDRVFNYLEWTIGHFSKRSLACQTKLLDVVQCILKDVEWTKSKHIYSLLKTLILFYWGNEIQPSFKEKLFTLLCSIPLNNSSSHLQSTEYFQPWLCELPNVISGSETISLESFNVIYKLAVQNNCLFNASIKSKLELLVRNLPVLKITEISDQKTARMKLIGLLYWIKPWDNDSLNVLQDQLASGVYDSEERQYLVDILKAKLNGIFIE